MHYSRERLTRKMFSDKEQHLEGKKQREKDIVSIIIELTTTSTRKATKQQKENVHNIEKKVIEASSVESGILNCHEQFIRSVKSTRQRKDVFEYSICLRLHDWCHCPLKNMSLSLFSLFSDIFFSLQFAFINISPTDHCPVPRYSILNCDASPAI